MNPIRLYIYNIIVSILPQTRFFRFKRFLLKFCGAKIGTNVKPTSSARFHLTGNLTIGENTWIGHEVLIVGGNANIIIGKNVAIAPRTTLISGSHHILRNGQQSAGKGFSKPIHICDGVWVGANSTILGGVTVGECSVVGACSMVNDDIPPNITVVGIPAKEIKP